MHILHVLGFNGDKRAYLNITLSEAIRRYEKCSGEPLIKGEKESGIITFRFGDEFGVYDAWELT